MVQRHGATSIVTLPQPTQQRPVEATWQGARSQGQEPGAREPGPGARSQSHEPGARGRELAPSGRSAEEGRRPNPALQSCGQLPELGREEAVFRGPRVSSMPPVSI